MTRARTASTQRSESIVTNLNPQQRAVAEHGDLPLLIVAGAGTGKTKTLVHRVARLIDRGVPPGRILLLTFTRRAAAEMLRRVEGLLGRSTGGGRVWGGTFHSIASRLLRHHGKAIGLDPSFTIHDRSDSEDLLDLVRSELELRNTDKRFPRKATCLAIYSHCVNSQRPLAEVLADSFPWCLEWEADLKRLFAAYVDRKDLGSVLDYDDLLLFWRELLDSSGQKVRSRFDHVLVDEYQDTNRLQAEILRLLRPDGKGLTAVGDDAQSIYSFRGATVRNILDFPDQFPGTRIVALEQNYRSTQRILDAANQVLAQAGEGYAKTLWSERAGGEMPELVTCADEYEQVEFVITQILARREAGVDLRRQAVLVRTSHHSILLEGELVRRNIPFVKYGGLKFLETAHVKDLIAFLRLAENPRDLLAGNRVLQLLPGIGPKGAHRLMNVLDEAGGRFAAWDDAQVPSAAADDWPLLLELFGLLTQQPAPDVPLQVQRVREFYWPFLQQRYDNAESRHRDLEQLETVAARYASRQQLLEEISLDPPTTTEDLAGPPHLDEDYLVLSTIHSAKGLEWDSVHVIHAADGNIPSDMATKSDEQIEEERRLFYVALTRAENLLCVVWPLRYFHAYRGPRSDQHGYAQLTRFIPEAARQHFRCGAAAVAAAEEDQEPVLTSADVRRKLRAMWR
jgi:DNA helicase II / ATP-dependent DNA helicase PcrA